MHSVFKVAAVAAAVAGILGGAAARADEDGSWEVRLRGVYLDPANKSDAIPALAVPENAIHINGKWLPDLDFEYFFTPNWSTELVLTYPQKQTVTVEQSALGGPTNIGTFKHLPPTLTAKYDFLPDQVFQPYVGLGVNMTLLMDRNVAVPTVGPLTLDTWSFGPAAQAGFDLKLAPHWYFNADVKWAMIRTDIKFDGEKISEARVDPFLFGLGIGYRFGGSPAPAPAPAPPPPQPVRALPPPPAPEPTPPPPPPPPRHITLNADALFAFDKAQIRPEGAADLDKLATELQTTQFNHVHVTGYTDRIGSDAYNLHLSQQRADAVKSYLVDKGVDGSKIETQGMGKANPVTKPGDCGAKRSKATIACLQPDRRVDIEVAGFAQ